MTLPICNRKEDSAKKSNRLPVIKISSPIRMVFFLPMQHKKTVGRRGWFRLFSIAFIQEYPEKNATVFELPAVCIETNKYIEQYNLLNKISVTLSLQQKNKS